MAIVRVKHVDILGFLSLREKIIERLQEEEIFHPELEEEIKEEGELKNIERVIKILKDYEEKSFLEGIFSGGIYIKKDEFKKISPEENLSHIKRIEEIAKNREEILKEKRILEEKRKEIAPFLSFPLNYKNLASLKYLSLVFLKINKKEKEVLEKKGLNLKHMEKDIYLVCVEKENKDFFKFLEENKIKVLKLPYDILKEYPESTFLEIDNIFKDRIEDLEKKLEENEKSLKEYAKIKKDIILVYDFLNNKNFKKSICSFLKKTNSFFYLSGWIAKKDEERFLNVMKEFKDFVFFKLRDPLPQEKPPTLLENKKTIAPFQVIVDMYGPPHPSSVDPTLILAPFFFLFVGICISDAGYGVILSLFSLYILRKRKLTPQGKNFFKLLFYLGISTTSVGLALGGFLGFSLPFKIMDMINKPFNFLLFCLILGYIQVLLGLGIKCFLEIKEKNQVFISSLSWMGLLLVLPFYFIFKLSFLKILSIIFVLNILFFSSKDKNIFKRIPQGLYELYGITKYFSDILSYSRLLALGMATGVIAMVVNLLAKQALGIPIIGYIIFLLIFLGGHIFNLLINLMGGFIHSARLQFVEFFSKFFRLGYKFFSPLKINTKYIRLID